MSEPTLSPANGAFAFAPIRQPALPISGSVSRFPVRRIFCVGRNYGEHVREMGGDPKRDAPFFFCKPADAIVQSGASIPYPTLTTNFHHEIELVVAIAAPALDVSVADANTCIFGYAAGIDLTRRDIQMDAMHQGHPWELGKAFDRSAPCAAIVPASQAGNISDAPIWLKVNGQSRQAARTSELIWSVPEIISILSRAFELHPGDLIYTGTPAGVGPIVSGDRLVGGVGSLPEIEIQIGTPRE